MSPMGPMGLMGQMSPMGLMGQRSPIGPMGLMSPMSPMGLMGQRSPIGQVYAHRGFLSNRRDHSSQANGHVLDSRGVGRHVLPTCKPLAFMREFYP